jgi:hypothetical protein
MFLQIFFGQIFQVSFREIYISPHGDLLVIAAHFYRLTKVTDSACNFDSRSQELCEVRRVEYFILNWFGTVDSEHMRYLRLNLLVFRLDFGGEFSGGLFCGHRNIIFN